MKSELLMQVQDGFIIICMFFMAILIFLCLIRAIRGPRLTDRIISGNMIGTMTIISIALLSVLLKESYLLDVCLIEVIVKHTGEREVLLEISGELIAQQSHHNN